MAPKKEKPKGKDRVDADHQAKFAALAKLLNEETPEKLVEQGEDTVGYWLPEFTPIVCIPRSAKLFDGKLNPSNPSILIVVEVTKPCAIARKDENGELVPDVAEPGQLVGVWGKPGMRAIRQCADVAGVTIRLTGEERVTKKGLNPMKLYSVKAPSGCPKKLIPVTEDARERSLDVRTFLDIAVAPARDSRGRPKAEATEYEGEEENEPYQGQFDQSPEDPDLDTRAGL